MEKKKPLKKKKKERKEKKTKTQQQQQKKNIALAFHTIIQHRLLSYTQWLAVVGCYCSAVGLFFCFYLGEEGGDEI